MPHGLSIIIAGTTGLVGHETLKQSIYNQDIKHIYSLSRRKVAIEHPKLTQWVDNMLQPPEFNNLEHVPSVGIIALGTTLKIAGSKENFHRVDVTLVIEVAQKMQQLGVEYLIVVSSLGASLNSRSHYLRCKGEMEAAVQQINFKSITFMQPGPLLGKREKPRKDERWLQWLMKIISPMLRAGLVNYKPIDAPDIASAIIQLALKRDEIKGKLIKRINCSQMLNIISNSH